MTNSDIDAMVFAVQALMLFHGIALIAYWVGDSIGDAFKKDENKNGIPDFMERKDKKNNQQAQQNHNQPNYQQLYQQQAELMVAMKSELDKAKQANTPLPTEKNPTPAGKTE